MTDGNSQQQMLEAALNYAESGFPVFPCRPLSKAPLTSDGFKSATTDTDQIERWWTKTPDANIGIATAGLAVSDVDGSENPWLRDDPEKHADLVTNAVSVTPRGGCHFWFTQNGTALTSTTNDPAPQVDLRADGGYVVAPPSRVVDDAKGIDGKYEWKIPLGMRSELTPLPTWYSSALRQSQRIENPSSMSIHGDCGNIADSGRAMELVSQMLPEIADDYDSWLRVGMALHSISPHLLFVWEDFSRSSSKYVTGDCERRWRGFRDTGSNSVGMGTLRHYAAQGRPEKPSKLVLIDSPEFFTNEYPVDYIIEDVLVHRQNQIYGAPMKCMKTSIAVDMCLSIGTGTPFLGQFDVKEALPVALFSGESGEATLQETARRVAFSKQVDPQSAKVLWCFNLPQLTDKFDLEVLRKIILDNELAVVVIDPLYQCLLGIDLAATASNVYAQGQSLRPITELGSETNCTFVLLHHSIKSKSNDNAPMELHHLSQAGIAEWARQWLLLNRREKFEPGTGFHKLWMTVGGSAGHQGLYAVDIDEGVHVPFLGGRKWDVTVRDGGEALQEARDQEANRKNAKADAEHQSRVLKVMETLRKHPNGLTLRKLATYSGMGEKSAGAAVQELIDDGTIDTCKIRVSNHKEAKYEGYRIPERALHQSTATQW